MIAVCEPDGTFMAVDIFKLLWFNLDFDAVYGSRTMNDLIWEGANKGWFLRFGNWSVAKLTEVLFNSCSLSGTGFWPDCPVKGSTFGRHDDHHLPGQVQGGSTTGQLSAPGWSILGHRRLGGCL